MEREAILLDLIKETRQTIRDIQARIYNLSTTFVVSSFAVTAFAWEKAREHVVSVTLFSDFTISVVLIYLYIRIYGEHKLVRLALERNERTLISLLNGESVPSQDIVAPLLDMKKMPAFSITREVNLFLWAAGIIIIKSAILVAMRP